MRTTEQIERAVQALRQFGQSLPDDYTLAELCCDVMVARGLDGERIPDGSAGFVLAYPGCPFEWRVKPEDLPSLGEPPTA